MREIPVRNAPHPALVDDGDFALVGHLKWALLPSGGHAIHFFHDKALKKTRGVLMHRLILDAPRGMVVDHIDHDGLHNWRANLRLCSQRDNLRNKRKTRSGKTSQFKGVYVDKRASGFIASITVDYRTIRIGTFDNEIDAALAYNERALREFGEFACLNNIDQSMRESA